MNNIVKQVDLKVRNIVEELGYELVEVKYEQLDGENFLTLIIYKESGITFNDCKIVTEAVDLPLDELNPTNDEPYSLNVSSLGLDRPIKTKRDFERYLNKKIEVVLNDNTKFVAVIVSVNENDVCLNVKGIEKTYKISDINRAMAFIKF